METGVSGSGFTASRLRAIPSLPVPSEARKRLPDRYRLRSEGRERVLLCVDAPTLSVRLERGRSVSESAARSARPGTIFLDGAAQAPPFLDSRRGVFNLDHHEGCARPFTLSTCEQAMVLVRRVQDLRKRDWTVYANDSDLDSVLAIWVLFNHMRIQNDPRVRRAIMPLLRLEGAIDVHGLESLDLAGLSEGELERARTDMRRLQEVASQVGEQGPGERGDLAAVTAELLRAIDAQVYTPEQLEDACRVEELTRVPVSPESVAVACRSESGIYEVERELRRFHGDRLGLIVLQKGPRSYSLRQVDPSLPADLETVYAHLNRVDPATRRQRSGNSWGGSVEIGGSPRKTGSRLSVEQVARALAHVYRPASRRQRLARIGRVSCLAVAAMACALAAVPLAALLDARVWQGAPFDPRAPFAATLACLCAGSLLVAARRTPALYGLRLPAGGRWWRLLPLALVGAGLGGVWAPPWASGGVSVEWIGTALLLPVCAELLFRSLAHGSLTWVYPVQPRGGARFSSRPVLVSALLYAPWSALPLFAAPELPDFVPALVPAFDLAGVPDPVMQALALALPVAGGLLFGIAAGIARERSESVAAAILFHWMGVAAVLLLQL